MENLEKEKLNKIIEKIKKLTDEEGVEISAELSYDRGAIIAVPVVKFKKDENNTNKQIYTGKS
ncbi:hypothetical protein [Persephonella sp.]